ncbi:MAG: regulatory protein LuxR [Sphingomonas bacterium]|uniref:helix-turn-helix domain-containing protein n=1 Tax=Sphingomonas bacterium TaxID=1895847 RepID=UPI00260598C9|nr:helix-turn-helix transcriptional regulator [Sphingomonas bacterium]MDB5705954.1 regulatory protein LuxR [Sphingomonas bacterium]
MGAERIDRLTPAQKACLRLVPFYGTDAIAGKLGIAPGTVNNHIAAAVKVLGVTSRKTAARLLIESEGAPEKLPMEKIGMVGGAVAGEETLSFPARGAADTDRESEVVREERTPFLYPAATMPTLSGTPPIKGYRNDLTPLERLRRTGADAMRITAFIATIMFAIFLLERINWEVFHH